MVTALSLSTSFGPRLSGVASLERPQGPRAVVRAGHGGRQRRFHLRELHNLLPRGGRFRVSRKYSHLDVQPALHLEREKAVKQPGTAPADGDYQASLVWLLQLHQPDEAGAKPGRPRQDLGDETSAGPAAGRRGGIAQMSEFGCYRHLAARRVVRPQNCQSLLEPRPGIVGTASPKVSHLLRPPAVPDQPAPRDAEPGPLGPHMRKVVRAMSALGLGRGMEALLRANRFLSGLEAVGGCYFNGLRLYGLLARGLMRARAVVFI